MTHRLTDEEIEKAARLPWGVVEVYTHPLDERDAAKIRMRKTELHGVGPKIEASLQALEDWVIQNVSPLH